MPNSNLNEPSCQEIIIFGGVGDLAWRKLLPALYLAHAHSRLDADCRIQSAVGMGQVQGW